MVSDGEEERSLFFFFEIMTHIIIDQLANTVFMILGVSPELQEHRISFFLVLNETHPKRKSRKEKVR